jgi:two-component system, cell cycle sensor histidine kinase and response regulator CckA
MLYQELPRIQSTPLDGAGRWLGPALTVAAGLTAALLLVLIAQPLLALAAGAVAIVAAAFIYLRRPRHVAPSELLIVGPDFSLIGSALGLSREPAALTTSEGSLLIANAAYRDGFGGSHSPLELAEDEEARQ